MGKVTQYLATHRKALIGAVLAGGSAAVAALLNGSTWQVIVVAVVAGALGVGGVPNAKQAAKIPAAK